MKFARQCYLKTYLISTMRNRAQVGMPLEEEKTHTCPFCEESVEHYLIEKHLEDHNSEIPDQTEKHPIFTYYDGFFKKSSEPVCNICCE